MNGKAGNESDAPLVRRLFLQALELPTAQERQSLLAEACGGDTGLQAKVEALLQNHREDGFLERPAQEAISPLVSPAGAGVFEKPGDFIGRYKLLEKLGEGGCGVVYVAEQHEPVRRRVALKVIKLGMDTRSVVARFEAERQALAMMDHPSIAKVLDAGATETGRPFFVMELVRGIRITDYCDQNRLLTEERLDLFLHVCRAVQHAHQKGIIHRDLKPSNILVTVNDPGSPGVPKVIDFGIAKATEGRLTDKTVFTELHQFIGTPAYMSPEQAEMTSADIDTRSDIYTLGVLLYELLTGKTPFEHRELLQAGLEVMCQTIRAKEPPRPSTRLSTLAAGDLSTVAKARGSEPPKLIHAVRGDLDWIVMKCLEKDRARRYETANGLARDIERHLHNEPVVARPPSRLYEFQKTIQRHKAGFAATAAVVAALGLAAVLSTVEAVHARRAEQDKERLRGAAVEAATREAKALALAQERLYDARLAEARAKRLSGMAGQRFESLAAISEAATIHRSLELSDEAAACLALADLQVRKTVEVPSIAAARILCFDDALKLYAYPESNGFQVRRVEDGGRVAFLPVAGAVHRMTGVPSVAFDRSSRHLACQCQIDGTQLRDQVWALDQGGRLVLDTPSRRLGDPLGFRADGQVAAVAAQGGIVTLVELESGKKLREFKAGGQWARASISPDGSKVATWGLDPYSAAAQVWDVASGQLELSLQNSNAVENVCWNRDGSLAACASRDGPIWVWDLRSGKIHARMEGHTSLVHTTVFDHRGNLLASSSWDGTARLWDVATGRQLVLYPKYCPNLQFSLDDELLAGARDGRKRELLAVARSTGERGLPYVPGKGVQPTVEFTPDGRLLAFPSAGGIAFADVLTGQWTGFLDAEGAAALQFGTARKPTLYAITAAGLAAWEVESRSAAGERFLRFHPPRLFLAGARELRHCVTDRDERRCVVACSGKGMYLLDLQEPRSTPRRCVHPECSFVSLDPSGRWAASGTWKGTGVRVWDFNTGELVRELPVAGTANIAFSPDTDWLATVNDAEFRLWKTSSWSPVPESLPGDLNSETGIIAFSPDSRLLATCHDARQIQIARVPTLEVVARLLAPPTMSFHLDSLCFSPDGSRLAALNDETERGMVHLWDLRAIRSELKKLNLDWDLPPYSTVENPPSAATPVPRLDTGPFSLEELAHAIPPRDSNAPASLVDLTGYYNAPLTANWHPTSADRSDLSELPAGRQKLAGVEFDVRGLVQIGYAGANGFYYPDHIDGIPIGRACGRLHFLHAAIGAADAHPGDELGSYLVQYVDGRELQIPIVFGKDLADWWSQPNGQNLKLVIAWEGNTPEARQYHHTVRLFKSTWENPRPNVRLRQFDFVSHKPASGAPFLVAVTAEP